MGVCLQLRWLPLKNLAPHSKPPSFPSFKYYLSAVHALNRGCMDMYTCAHTHTCNDTHFPGRRARCCPHLPLVAAARCLLIGITPIDGCQHLVNLVRLRRPHATLAQAMNVSQKRNVMQFRMGTLYTQKMAHPFGRATSSSYL